MVNGRIHISQREAFSSCETWLNFLEGHNGKFDYLILREQGLNLDILSALSKRLSQPIILNVGLIQAALSTDNANLDNALKDVKGLHLKGEEVTRLVELGSEGKFFLEEIKLKYKWMIGTSVHSVEQVKLANSLGCFDYFLVSPVRVTCCKPSALALLENERQQILEASKVSSKPPKLIALGGMNYRDLTLARLWGFDGVAGRNQFLFSE